MRRSQPVLALFALLLFIPQALIAAGENWCLIHAGQLLAVPGNEPASQQTIVIAMGRIEAIHDGYKMPDDLGLAQADVINLKDSFVLPGLLDMHTHLTGQRDPEANRHRWTTQYESDWSLQSLPFLERTLMAGFTTVRDVGGLHTVILPLKRAVDAGTIPGPRIIAATSAVSATGGHGDFHGYRKEILDLHQSVGICDGADDCRRAVRALVKQGADVIKITATGGVLSNTAAGVAQQLTDDELTAIVETAHSLGRKVAAHAHGTDGINAALRAGVDSIEHGTFLDEESISLFKKSGAYLVPTILAGTTIMEEAEVNDKIPPAIRDKIALVGPQMAEGFERAVKGNVNIAFGTDSGVSRHGDNAREFELMVAGGMTPADTIKAATISAADLLDRTESLGTLEPGKMADIIAVKGNPLTNISELRDVDFVMKGGKVYKQ
jgi:imidazolonepropionase-like amidohydrolase